MVLDNSIRSLYVCHRKSQHHNTRSHHSSPTLSPSPEYFVKPCTSLKFFAWSCFCYAAQDTQLVFLDYMLSSVAPSTNKQTFHASFNSSLTCCIVCIFVTMSLHAHPFKFEKMIVVTHFTETGPLPAHIS